MRVLAGLADGPRSLAATKWRTGVLAFEGRDVVERTHVVAVERDREPLGALRVLGDGERGAHRVGRRAAIRDQAAREGRVIERALASADDAQPSVLAARHDNAHDAGGEVDARHGRSARPFGARLAAVAGGSSCGHVLRSNARGPRTVPSRSLRAAETRPCPRRRRSPACHRRGRR